MNFPRQKAVSTLIKSPALSIKSKTLFDAASLVAKIKTGKYAPAMLKFFGLEAPNYMIEPQFTI